MQSVEDGARPPGGGPLRLLARLSLNSGAAVEAGWAPHCPSLGVTRLRCGSLLLSADREVLWSRAAHSVTMLTDVTLSRWSRAAWSRRGCWHATDCGLAPAAARSLAPAARSHRWRLARQRGPAHAHHTPHILLALGQAGGRLGRGGGRTRD